MRTGISSYVVRQSVWAAPSMRRAEVSPTPGSACKVRPRSSTSCTVLIFASASIPKRRRSRVALRKASIGISCRMRWVSPRRTCSPALCAADRYEASEATTLAMVSIASNSPSTTARGRISGGGSVCPETSVQPSAGSSRASGLSCSGSICAVKVPSRSSQRGPSLPLTAACW